MEKTFNTAKDLKTFRWIDGKEYYDIKLTDMNLSVRSYHCLKKSNYDYFSKIYSLTQVDLNHISSMGTTSITEILNYINTVQLIAVQNNNQSDFEKLCEDILSNITEKISFNANEVYSNLDRVLMKFSLSIAEKNVKLWNKERVFGAIANDSYFVELFQNHILLILDKDIYGKNLEQIQSFMPTYFASNNITSNYLYRLLKQSKITPAQNKLYTIRFKPFKEIGHNFLKDKEYDIICQRIEGKTLNEIGENLNITRERIRQIESKGLSKLKNSGTVFKEDIYSYIFKNYSISKEDFKLAFNENVETYNYLELIYKHCGKIPLKEIFSDEKTPYTLRKLAEKAVYKNYVFIDNQYVKLDKESLSLFILRKLNSKSINFQDFVNLYADLLKKIGKEDDKKLALMERGYENKLSTSDIILWKYGKKFRYYNMKMYDFKELLDTINLNQYNNIEYSTLKFFLSYPELMADYDIQDEYELHNLLKKICNKKDYPNLEFKRMPNLEFGNANRDTQVIQLLSRLSPILGTDFAHEYELEYGVRAATVLANYMKNFDQYFYDGVYEINFPNIPAHEKLKLKALLTEDFYLFSKVSKIYKDNFPLSPTNLLNPYSLKTLGFKSYSNYIINSKYPNAVDYFNHLLTSQAVFNLTNLDKGIKSTIAYTSELYKLKSNFQILETNPNNYINISQLKPFGFTDFDLKNFSHEALGYVNDAEFFTINSLKKRGFDHPLLSLNYSDYFYTSILIQNKTEVSYRKIKGEKLLFKGNCAVNLVDFIEFYLGLNEKVGYSFQELIDQLKDIYKIELDSYKISEFVRAGKIYYDLTSKKLYKNFSAYEKRE